MKYGLNEEQWAAINAPSPTIVNASAGSGKTRCLVAKIRLLLENGELPSSILAITFTNKAANEMKTRLKENHDIKGMQISTIHSMCVRIIREYARYTPLKAPFTIYDTDDQLSVIKTVLKAKDFADNPRDIRSEISRAKSDRTIYELEGNTKIVYEQYQEILIANNACDFDDLLVYALDCLNNDDCMQRFQRLWKHILVDEMQDTSQIQYEIVLRLFDPKKTKTLFMVGDANQCVVSGTKIGGRPAEEIQSGDFILSADGRGSCEGTMTSRVYRKDVIDKPVVTITTVTGESVTLTNEHMVFAEFVDIPEKGLFFTYLMYREDLGYRIGLTQTRRARGEFPGVLDFKMRVNQEKGDAIWLLRACETKTEAKYYEEYFSVTYGIPTWFFHHQNHGIRLDYDEGCIKRLFREVDTRTHAEKLLNDLGLLISHPHYVPKCMSKRRRRNFTITQFGDQSGGTYGMHRYSVSGSDEDDQKVLEAAGFKTRLAKGHRGYRIENSTTNLAQAYEVYRIINSIMPVNLIEAARFCKLTLAKIPAANVLPGMTCFVEREGKIEPELVSKVEKGTYSGTVFDFDVDRTHNYIANGIVVHNSIYAFRGARPDNIDNFIERYRPSIKNLTYNYRSCSEIIEHANDFLQYGNSMVSKSDQGGQVSLTMFRSVEEEAEKIAEALLRMQKFDATAILYRVNARSLQFERTFARYHIPYKVVGDLPFFRRRVVKDLLAMLRASNNTSDVESLARIINVPKRGFGEAKIEKLLLQGREYVEEMAKDMIEVRLFLELLDEVQGQKPYDALQKILHGTQYRQILKKESDIFMVDALLNVALEYDNVEDLILASTFLDKDSGRGVQLMTAHASKGLEFDRVFIVGLEEGVWPHKLSVDPMEENRLFYVACTRAKRYLNISCSKSRTFRGSTVECSPSTLFHKMYQKMFGKNMP